MLRELAQPPVRAPQTNSIVKSNALSIVHSPARSLTTSFEHDFSKIPVTTAQRTGVVQRQTNSNAKTAEDAANASAVGGECALIRYSSSNFYEKTVVADLEFVSSLDKIAAYAEARTVKLNIRDSFREAGRTVAGAIVKPASRSNH